MLNNALKTIIFKKKWYLEIMNSTNNKNDTIYIYIYIVS